jgi:hypothetical protein
MDEAIGLLNEALGLMLRDNRPEVESWADRVEGFIGGNK